MSRWLALLFAMTLLSDANLASAQSEPAAPTQRLSQEQVADILKQQKNLNLKKERVCGPDPEEPDVIIVCADNSIAESQKLPVKEKLGRGECKGGFIECGRRLAPPRGIEFGYVKPMALDWDTVMEGLPEPNEVVTDEDAKTQSAKPE